MLINDCIKRFGCASVMSFHKYSYLGTRQTEIAVKKRGLGGRGRKKRGQNMARHSQTRKCIIEYQLILLLR